MSRSSENRIEELEWSIKRVLQTFEASEERGQGSRDTRFAIGMLRDVMPKEKVV